MENRYIQQGLILLNSIILKVDFFTLKGHIT